MWGKGPADYELPESDGVHFITMEYVEGRSLADALAANRGPFSLEQVLPWAKRMAGALYYAHSQQVLHRDVKPGNMLLGRDGSLRLADFGIARVACESQTRLTGRDTSGTLAYMSPEQLMGERLDARSDMYSLAASLYELLSGNPPFHSGSIPTQIQLKAPTPIVGLPDPVNAVLLKALAKRPQDRQADCAEFWQELSAAATGERKRASVPEPMRPTRTKQPWWKALRPWFDVGRMKSRPILLGAGALVVLGLLVLAVSGLRGGSHVPVAGNDVAPQARHQATSRGASASQPNQERTFAGIEMVWIPPGTFMMGSPADEQDRGGDETQHQVTLTRGFWMGKYEVTQAQWQAVMGNNPSHFKGDDLPVKTVSWDNCQEFVQKLNAKGEGAFRLATEAEWEYACRAATETAYCFGNDAARLGEYAWYNGNSDAQPHAVGQKNPNAWGLCDMHGNLWEWCQDWKGDYPTSAVTDPTGPASDAGRVVRAVPRHA